MSTTKSLQPFTTTTRCKKNLTMNYTSTYAKKFAMKQCQEAKNQTPVLVIIKSMIYTTDAKIKLYWEILVFIGMI